MLARIRCALTYANVMSTIAVFGVLGGGAYAAAQIGADDIKRNAVRSKHIKNGQVGRKHLKARAVSAAKLATGAVKEPKIATGAVTEAKLADGAVDRREGERIHARDGAERRPPRRRRRRGAASRPGRHPRGPRNGRPRQRRIGALPATGAGNLTLDCRNPASAGSVFKFTNTSGSTADVWTDRVQDGSIPANQIFYSSVANGDNATISISGPVVLEGRARARFTIVIGNQVTLVEARIVFLAGACSFNVIATEMAT